MRNKNENVYSYRRHIYTEKKQPDSKNKAYFFLFIFMTVSIMLFFFGYLQYQNISKNYQQAIVNETWIQQPSNIEQDLPTTLLVVGMSFADSGRIEAEQSLVWRLITINPQTKKTLVADINPQLIVNEKPLIEYHPLNDKHLIENAIEALLKIEIDYYSVIHLNDLRPLIDLNEGLTVQSPQNLQVDDLNIIENQETLLSSRLVLQYMLHHQGDTDLSRSQRNGAVLSALWNKVRALNNPLNWNAQLNEMKNVVVTSVSWLDFLKLKIGPYAEAMSDVEYMLITDDTKVIYQEKINTYIAPNE